MDDKKEISRVRRYSYGDDLSSFLSAAFAENDALRTLWHKKPPGLPIARVDGNKLVLGEVSQANKLIVEATEYYVLKQLSLHLSRYFNSASFSEKELKQYSRNDVPDVLLQNRFMELFSRPMDQRPAFVERGSGNVVFASGPGGVRYDRFELTLPKGSSLTRIGEGAIAIKTSRFSLRLSAVFMGTNTVLPSGFGQRYLGLVQVPHRVFEIGIKAEVTFAAASYLSATGWEYHRWIDSFLEKLEDRVSTERFFRKINWDSALTLIEAMEQKQALGPSAATAVPNNVAPEKVEAGDLVE